MIEMIKGDITNTNCRLIVHGVNCQNKMGSGVAKALYMRWPEVKRSYHRRMERLELYDPHDLLGMCFFENIDKDLIIAHCLTQQNYGYDGQVYLNYDALKECLEEVAEFIHLNDITEIAMPKIGCGLAGGDWNRVRELIEYVFHSEITVKVYYLK